MLKHTCKEVDSHPLTPIPLPPKEGKKGISPKAAWKNVTFTGCGTGLGGSQLFLGYWKGWGHDPKCAKGRKKHIATVSSTLAGGAKGGASSVVISICVVQKLVL